MPRRKANTVDGKPCKTCGETKRYANSGVCYTCCTRRTAAAQAKHRETINLDRAYNGGRMPVPATPNRKQQAYWLNEYGERVFQCPIVARGLIPAGSYENVNEKD